MAVIIRDAVPGDAAQIRAIWNPLIAESVVTFTSQLKSAEEITAMISARQASGFGFCVADDAGFVAGFVTYAQFRAGPGYAGCLEHSVMVHPQAHGQGVGRALMQAIFAAAKAQGHRMMIGAISGSNPAGVAFHAALGFEQVGHISGAGIKQGVAHDLVLMQKFL